jgi:hypothetical protein
LTAPPARFWKWRFDRGDLAENNRLPRGNGLPLAGMESNCVRCLSLPKRKGNAMSATVARLRRATLLIDVPIAFEAVVLIFKCRRIVDSINYADKTREIVERVNARREAGCRAVALPVGLDSLAIT